VDECYEWLEIAVNTAAGIACEVGQKGSYFELLGD